MGAPRDIGVSGAQDGTSERSAVMTHAIPVWRKGQIVAYAQVDGQDVDQVSAHRWSLHNRGYAITGGGSTKVLMHRMILGLASERGSGRGSGASRPQADHINGDKLDNRRVNLRVVTNQQNHQNRQTGLGNTSAYRGVYFQKKTGKWCARAKTNGKAHWGGYYDSEVDAAIAAWQLRKELMPYSVEAPPCDSVA
jgi:hypothetical protein